MDTIETRNASKHQSRFATRSGFHETVKQRVAQYFADSRQGTSGDWRLFLKTGVMLAWLAGPYALLVFVSTLLLLPCFLHPWLLMLLAFVAVHLILGLTLSLAFQLARTIERTSFPAPDVHTGMRPTGWAEHEVETTADFAPHNTVATSYLGG
jgi:hypothetical protein